MSPRFDRSASARARRAACAVCAIAIGACSAIVDTDKSKLGAMPVPCTVGQSALCPCSDGTQSTQRCNSSARFDPCMCKGSAGRPAAGSGAAGRSGSGGRAAAGRSGSAGHSGSAGR